uniref:Uncharacterized protein n=1 Tax=Panagrolaimus sp. JU765 TaxID=591449 RepID=A0AC34Q7G6_9BILA
MKLTLWSTDTQERVLTSEVFTAHHSLIKADKESVVFYRPSDHDRLILTFENEKQQMRFQNSVPGGYNKLETSPRRDLVRTSSNARPSSRPVRNPDDAVSVQALSESLDELKLSSSQPLPNPSIVVSPSPANMGSQTASSAPPPPPPPNNAPKKQSPPPPAPPLPRIVTQSTVETRKRESHIKFTFTFTDTDTESFTDNFSESTKGIACCVEMSDSSGFDLVGTDSNNLETKPPVLAPISTSAPPPPPPPPPISSMKFPKQEIVNGNRPKLLFDDKMLQKGREKLRKTSTVFICFQDSVESSPQPQKPATTPAAKTAKSTGPVSGTFWQLSCADSTILAKLATTPAGKTAKSTGPVSGTFWQLSCADSTILAVCNSANPELQQKFAEVAEEIRSKLQTLAPLSASSNSAFSSLEITVKHSANNANHQSTFKF